MVMLMPIVDAFIDNDTTWTAISANRLIDAVIEI